MCWATFERTLLAPEYVAVGQTRRLKRYSSPDELHSKFAKNPR